jgi:LPXTG-motif cell wall-anchored protein
MTRLIRVAAALLAAMTLLIGAAGPSAAQEAPAAVSAFGASIDVGGEALIPPTPLAEVDEVPGDASETLIDIPADPIAVSGTLTASASAHEAADIDTALTVVEQEVAGPYHARALGQVEQAGVVYDVAGADVALVSAALIRAEAAVVCGPTPTFTAASEIVDLAIGGEPVPLNAPVQDLIDAVSDLLATSGLNAVVDVQRNVVTDRADGGVSIDALVVTVLAAAGETPLGVVRIAHAEIGPDACSPPQCSDGADNDADGVIDSADPGCHTDFNAGNPASYDPNDDDERTECNDTADNDGDAVIDAADPGCHTDGNAANPATYDPNDNSELDAAVLPRTGGTSTAPLLAAALLAGGSTLAVLRRRLALRGLSSR